MRWGKGLMEKELIQKKTRGKQEEGGQGNPEAIDHR